jgi:hypothetical protein
MKRNPKPFSVEIKKSRGPNQHHQLLPRRLFEMTPVDVTRVFQKEETQTTAAPPPVPRILPSIVEPVWSNSEPLEPVHRKHSSVEANRGQMEFDLNASTSGGAMDMPAEESELAGAMSQADVAPAFAEKAIPVQDDQPAQIGSARANSRKARRKGPERVEPVTAFGSVSQPEQVPEAETIESLPTEGPLTVPNCRQARRRTAAAELPRHERWKRRLHAAAW